MILESKAVYSIQYGLACSFEERVGQNAAFLDVTRHLSPFPLLAMTGWNCWELEAQGLQ